MNDLKQRILKVFEKQPLIAGFATITENGEPWVRYVSVVIDPKDMKIRFSTFPNTRKLKQIEKKPEVHLTCGLIDPNIPTDYLQIQGKAYSTRDKKERHAMWNKEMAEYFKSPDDPNFIVVIIEPYRIELMPPGSFEPLVWNK